MQELRPQLGVCLLGLRGPNLPHPSLVLAGWDPGASGLGTVPGGSSGQILRPAVNPPAPAQPFR